MSTNPNSHIIMTQHDLEQRLKAAFEDGFQDGAGSGYPDASLIDWADSVTLSNWMDDVTKGNKFMNITGKVLK